MRHRCELVGGNWMPWNVCYRRSAVRPAAVRRTGVPGVSSVWLARRRVRSVSLRRLRSRPSCPLLVQGPRDLSELRWPQDGRLREYTHPAV